MVGIEDPGVQYPDIIWQTILGIESVSPLGLLAQIGVTGYRVAVDILIVTGVAESESTSMVCELRNIRSSVTQLEFRYRFFWNTLSSCRL